MTSKLITGAELLGELLTDVKSGKPPERFGLNPPFGALDARPGRLLLFGGSPGAGKTAALLQIAIDLLRQNTKAKLLIANVEMSPMALLERIVARLSGVSLTTLMDRKLRCEDTARLHAVVRAIEAVASRFAVMGPPFTLEQVAACGTEFDCNVIVLDYLQRFSVGTQELEQRERIDTVVSILRQFCNMGAFVLCAAAVSRQKGGNGSTYAGLNLASFRGSSELEFGADACYLMVRESDTNEVVFQCEKNRYGLAESFHTTFNPAIQSFEPAAELSPFEQFDRVKPAPERGKKAKGTTE